MPYIRLVNNFCSFFPLRKKISTNPLFLKSIIKAKKIWLVLFLIIAISIVLSSCKKENILLTGSWTQIVTVPEGTMITTFHFNEPGRYTLESSILYKDLTTIIQSCPGSGSYSLKSSGVSFRLDGNRFDWATNGYVNEHSLTIKVIPDKSKSVFVKND